MLVMCKRLVLRRAFLAQQFGHHDVLLLARSNLELGAFFQFAQHVRRFMLSGEEGRCFAVDGARGANKVHLLVFNADKIHFSKSGPRQSCHAHIGRFHRLVSCLARVPFFDRFLAFAKGVDRRESGQIRLEARKNLMTTRLCVKFAMLP